MSGASSSSSFQQWHPDGKQTPMVGRRESIASAHSRSSDHSPRKGILPIVPIAPSVHRANSSTGSFSMNRKARQASKDPMVLRSPDVVPFLYQDINSATSVSPSASQTPTLHSSTTFRESPALLSTTSLTNNMSNTGNNINNSNKHVPKRHLSIFKLRPFAKNRMLSTSGLVLDTSSAQSASNLHANQVDATTNDGKGDFYMDLSNIHTTQSFPFTADTDMSNMDGIVTPTLTPRSSKLNGQMNEKGYFSNAWYDKEPESSWVAPESWAVNKQDDTTMNRLDAVTEEAEVQEPIDEEINQIFGLRIFKEDQTFATVAGGLSMTCNELMITLGRKFFLPSIYNYQIFLERAGLLKIISPHERPFLIQRRLFEQAGYTDPSFIQKQGREDNSYLCRFLFTNQTPPSNFSGMNSDQIWMDGDGRQIVDISANNLFYIPVSLYPHSSTINTLNLSKNYSLDVPSDFIEACLNLEELIFCFNQIKRIPFSFLKSRRLKRLNVSHNRLKDVESVKNSNFKKSLQRFDLCANILTTLPEHFTAFDKLTWIDISNNYFNELPLVLCKMKNIEYLDISFNQLKEIPTEISNLSKLQIFKASNNILEGTLQQTMFLLTELLEVDLRFNSLQNIDSIMSLPKLAKVWAGNNMITEMKSYPAKCEILDLKKNGITNVAITNMLRNLIHLNLKSAKIASFSEQFFDNIPNLEELILDRNHLVHLPPKIGNLRNLRYLSCVENKLESLPAEIGRLQHLQYLDVHANNLKQFPDEIWLLSSLVSLNASSNVLATFPRPPRDQGSISSSPSSKSGSMTGPMLESLADSAARKVSVITAGGQRLLFLVNSLRALYLGDNQLTDDCLLQISLLTELRILNLSYNELDEIPHRALGRMGQLAELYLSGNNLNSLPADDFDKLSTLKVLHVNGNNLRTIPAELGKVRRLLVLDVGSNALKYNINNHPYDWNWNWNLDLKYLNLSGNKRLEIKPDHSRHNEVARHRSLSEFSALTKLRVLGLIDVTLMIKSVPEQSDDRRVRTSDSDIHSMSYGMADTLGRDEHLSVIDMVIPRFKNKMEECIFGMFEGDSNAKSGSLAAKFLQDNFQAYLSSEMDGLGPKPDLSIALQRAFLSLNRGLGSRMYGHYEINSTTSSLKFPGASALVIYIVKRKMFIANCGNIEAILSKTDGAAQRLSHLHNVEDRDEVKRVRDAAGYVSSEGKVNGECEMSRAFGYFEWSPIINAFPSVKEIEISEHDEFVIIANSEFWNYISYQLAVDIARQSSDNLMIAAEKLRDFAMSYGAKGKIMVMLIGVGELCKGDRATSYPKNVGSAQGGDQAEVALSSRKKRGKDGQIADSSLARLDKEVPAPVGDVTLVFTDIQGSTNLWDTLEGPMRAAIKVHNDIMRRQLRLIGGYEVKTEGDAFMVSFQTHTSALLWAFAVQEALLIADWPQEILSSPECGETFDEDGVCIYRGLSVRMGIHVGNPVCEIDPITRRMDYFGPMVNKSARIMAVAHGGQIAISSDFASMLERSMTELTEGNADSLLANAMDEELVVTLLNGVRKIRGVGYVMSSLGEKKLKGLENAELINLIFPDRLVPRLHVPKSMEKVQDGVITSEVKPISLLQPEVMLRLYSVVAKLENISASDAGNTMPAIVEEAMLRSVAEVANILLTRVSDTSLIMVCHTLVARIENTLNTIYLKEICKSLDLDGVDKLSMGEISSIKRKLQQ